MQVRSSDERDSTWERYDPLFRVYVFRGPSGVSHTLDIEGATLTEALDQARMASEDDRSLWALALVEGRGEQRGLVWLSGADYHSRPDTAAERARRREMQDRLLAARSRRGEPVVLPNGHRLIRMFAGWASSPLWESFTENYPLDPASLDLPAALVDELLAWNAEWAARAEDEPLADADGWRRRGEVLADALDRALDGVAEVRREFLG
jgi:hypothetical protein